MIEFKGINKIFKNNILLYDMNLILEDGNIIVFVGPSGCGKTTIVKMINRIIKPT